MSTLEAALLFLTVEFALLAVALAYSQLRRGKRRERATLASVDSLVTTVAQSDAPRREALHTVLRESYRFDADKAERIVSDFIEREHAFYNALIGVHLGRGGKTLADVPAEVTRLIAPWLRLTPAPPADGGAVETLQSENQDLSRQLTETKQILDELMDEYSAAFLRNVSEPMVRVDGDAEASAPDLEADSAADDALEAVDLDSILDAMPAVADAAHDTPEATEAATGDPEIARGEAPQREDESGYRQRVIDLDSEEDPVIDDAPAPLSQSDLDALMDNLGMDELRESVPSP